LLKAGAELVVRDAHGRTSLLWAAYYGHADMLRLLLRADRSLLGLLDPDGRSAVHWASKNPSPKCLDVLLKVLICTLS
jgi:ankyrin repeat protein